MRQQNEHIYWEYLPYNDWVFTVAVTEKGLCRILQPNEPFEVLEKWAQRHLKNPMLQRDEIHTAPYIEQLKEYLSGERKSFDLSLDLRGTPFQQQVWKSLLRIPYGATRSYSDIATEIQCPKAVRAVGASNGANPVPIVVPCHRVIGKSGFLTGYRGGLQVKEELLLIEGVTAFRTR
ncbi:methylated-DNA--[protein]-cysteine S-methyltransferase [Effusibacillus lacus]|uniref:methylated-DNA--[protein]-cysteine S-methyltransferase n=1 Tax=Effusibacillus lacus TaxID=1348429 RepID=A0A292YE34_9BACL|nr:methylated-DNA--[protein]-cysteine S-methyltransferase [Effusibacillus lacus]GAX90982.1 cysteine methyltransferase [Effusibacillus lacus]